MTQHLTADRLRQWFDGRLTEADSQHVEAHLETCTDVCAAMLERIAQGEMSSSENKASISTVPPGAGDSFALATERPRAGAVPLAGGPLGMAAYEILGELGRGGMGVVYKARQIGLNRLCALKMILSGGHAGPDDLARFRTEAEAIARLQHPGIVQIYEIGEHDGRPFFSMEYCSKGSLEKKTAGQPLPPRQAAELVESLARAVHAAHGKGVVHRDLKPANVLLSEDGTPKISDFGLAKKLDVPQGQTHSGDIMGTPNYMAPEQARGLSKQVGPAADVYALGAILYDLLTGRPPFMAANPLDTVLQVIAADPVPVRRLQPRVPRDLETICYKCLHKEPGKRYASALALAEDVGCFLRGEPIQARPVRPWERAARWARRKPALATALGAVVLTVVVAVALITDSRNRAVRLADEKGRLADEKGKLADDNGRLLRETETLAGQRAIALGKEAEQRQRAEWHLYGGQAETAFRALRENQAELARTTLDACRWDFRGWEYYLARRQLDSARLVLECPGKLPNVLAFSSDGKRLAVAGSDSLFVCDALTGERLWQAQNLPSPVTGLAFAVGDTNLVSASKDGTARAWTDSGQGRGFTGHKAPIVSLAASPDGKVVATGDAKGTVLVWGPSTQKELHRYEDHKGEVALVGFVQPTNAFPFGPSRIELVSLGKDGKLVVRDVAKGTVKTETAQPGFKAAAVGGENVVVVHVSGEKSYLKFGNLRGPVWNHTALVPYAVLDVAFRPGRQLAVLARDDIHLLDWSGKEQGRVRGGVVVPSSLVAFAGSADGNTLAASGGWGVGLNRVKLWVVSGQFKQAAERKPSPYGNTKPTVDAVFTPDGRHVVVGRAGAVVTASYDPAGNGEVYIYTFPDLQLKHMIRVSSLVTSLAACADPRFVTSSHENGDAILWEVATGRRRRALVRTKPGPGGRQGPATAISKSTSRDR
jgi:WD40 repeat protein